MLQDTVSRRGLVVAPHRAAAESGRHVLRDGGNAIEAVLAAAATIAVVYPHMTGIGGDGFWLIKAPGTPPLGIDAAGRAGAGIASADYPDGVIGPRGPGACVTTPGAVAGWASALAVSRSWGGRLRLGRLLGDAIAHAENGVPVTASQAELTLEKQAELAGQPGFADVYLPGGRAPAAGQMLRQPALARSLRSIAQRGPADFYRGELADAIAADLARAGIPLNAADLANQDAIGVAPLSHALSFGLAYNLPPPTQGVASLAILGIFDRLGVGTADGFAHVHAIVEATKRAFRDRDRHVGDPGAMALQAGDLLAAHRLAAAAADIDMQRALPWPEPSSPGGTVWIGAVDGAGRAVSYIQSLYWEFGSGVVLRDTGIVWQNRGHAFTLGDSGPRALAPGRKPFHTLNPAMMLLPDGRLAVYGTMGGDGQPQTQAAMITRMARFGQGPAGAIGKWRWLLGRTWGDRSTSLKIEDTAPAEVLEALSAAGHEVEPVTYPSQVMGHAGAIVISGPGKTEGAADPRSDGIAAAELT